MKKALSCLRTAYRFCIVWLCTYFVAVLVYRHTPLIPGSSRLLLAFLSLFMASLTVYSLTRLLVLFDRSIKHTEIKTKKERLSFFLFRPKACLALILFAVLPFPTYAFAEIFGTHGLFLDYLISRSIMPILFLAYLFGGITGLSYCRLNRMKKRRTSDFFFILHAIKYLPIYVFCGMMLYVLIPSLLSIPGIVKLLLSLPIVLAVLLFYLVLWTVRTIRAVLTRRKFLRLLAQTCKEHGIEMPVIRHPYRSLFRKKASPVFHIVLNGNTYACKLIGTMRPYTLYRFYAEGMGARVKLLTLRFFIPFRTSAALYRSQTELWETRFDFAFDAEENEQKVLIFNPCAKIVQGDELGKRYPLDNGLSVGKYRFYTATGFCNALSRDCLGR